jgi:hypothetical protein
MAPPAPPDRSQHEAGALTSWLGDTSAPGAAAAVALGQRFLAAAVAAPQSALPPGCETRFGRVVALHHYRSVTL